MKETTTKSYKALNTWAIIGIIVIVLINSVVVTVYAVALNGKLERYRSVDNLYIGVRDNTMSEMVQLDSEDAEHFTAVFNALGSGTVSHPVTTSTVKTTGYEETQVTNSIYIGNGESELARARATEIFRAMNSGD